MHGATDIILVADSSVSILVEWVTALEDALNDSLAGPLDAAKIDFRLIVIGEFSSSERALCVPPPLSNNQTCALPPPGNVEGRFYHYAASIKAQDALCVVLDGLYAPDSFNLTPTGWSAWLRDDALKAFLMFADGWVYCWSEGNLFDDQKDDVAAGLAAANDWNDALLNLGAGLFGDPQDPNYTVYSLLAHTPVDPMNAAQPWLETDPVTVEECLSPRPPGVGHQWLSKNTDGLRWSICNPASYGAMLEQIAADLADKTRIPCVYEPPAPPDDQQLDPGTIVVTYTPAPDEDPVTLTPVAGEGACAGEGEFWFDGQRVQLCPLACAAIESNPEAALTASYLCP